MLARVRRKRQTRFMNPRRGTVVFLILCCLYAVDVSAMFKGPVEFPVERLVKTAEAAVAKNPESTDAHYTLARIHYLAFARGLGTVPVYLPEDERPLETAPEWMTKRWEDQMRWSEAERLAVAEAVRDGIVGPGRGREMEALVKKIHDQLTKVRWRPPVTQSTAER